MSSVTVPRTLEEALAALSKNPAATLLAGGTDLMVEINRGLRRPADVISLAQIPQLRHWETANNQLLVGAGVTYSEMMNTGLAAAAPALAQAARTVGSPPIRNAGTLGGNLGTASPAGDTLPVLAALNAKIVLTGPQGQRRLSLNDFMVGVKRTCIEPTEIITAAELDLLRGSQEYLKIGPRNAMVISLAGLALVADLEGQNIRCAMGAVAANIPRAYEAEAWVAQHIDWTHPATVDSAVSEEFGKRVAQESSPIDDHRSTAVYRRHAISVLAARALQRVFTKGGNGSG